MATEETTERFYFDKCTLSEDEDDGVDYDWVEEDAGGSSLDNYEDLNNIVKKLQTCVIDKEVEKMKEEKPKVTLSCKPELPEDYIRNFFVGMQMQKSLDAFQQEWFLMEQKNIVKPSDFEGVDDLYLWNMQLTRMLIDKNKEVDKLNCITTKCKERMQKLIKERDYHKMQHRRITQEKDRLRVDLRRLACSCSSMEPVMTALKEKYEKAMRDQYLCKRQLNQTKEELVAMIVKKYSMGTIDSSDPNINMNNKDKTAKKDHNNTNNNKLNNKTNNNNNNKYITNNKPNGKAETRKPSNLKNKSTLNENRFQKTQDLRKNKLAPMKNFKKFSEENELKNENKNNVSGKKDGNFNKNFNSSGPSVYDSKFTKDSRYNPDLSRVQLPCPFLLKNEGFTQATMLVAHDQTITSIKTRGDSMVTTSDDMLWKLWSLETFDLQVQAHGHLDWISDCDIDPSGYRLATSSGDTTVRIWDLNEGMCLHSFMSHRKAVWGVSWNFGGDFVASCSLDHTAKLWDLNSLRCKYTLRGHSDSVNSITFLHYSNILLTGSSDKTICIWDARTNICGGIYRGHRHSINSCNFSLKGNFIVSCDSGGYMNVWDVRQKQILTEMVFKPESVLTASYPTNKAAIAASAFTIKPPASKAIPGTEVCCNQCTFDPTGSVVAVACSDSIIRVINLGKHEVYNLQGNEDSVQCLAYDLSGEFLLSGGTDCTVRLWK